VRRPFAATPVHRLAYIPYCALTLDRVYNRVDLTAPVSDMRYQQNKQESAEILRTALTFMGKQEAAFHPPSYALWYEHVAGINPTLTKVLDERLGLGTPLTDADVWRMHAQYILTRDADAFERIRERLRVLLEETSHASESAGAHATHYGQALESHTARLKQSLGLEHIRDVVAELLADTQHMCLVTSELSEQLKRSTQEVQNLTQRLEQAQTEALLDPLTGLNNRRGLERAIQEVDGIPAGCALLLADIDNFKTLNDTHGHLLGDKVLRAVAQVIRSSIKGQDIAARMGGEEFAILLPETSVQGAAALAEKIRSATSKVSIRRIDRNEYVGNVTLSVGVAAAQAADSLDLLVERADSALYVAKRGGRNRVSIAAD
jgi:diguanylate cyclase